MLQNQMVKNNFNCALWLLTNNQSKSILLLDDATVSEIYIKHPEASPMYDDILIQGPIALVNKVIFDIINESEILRASFKN